VDFDINLLIFEVIDAGTFLQRLGRLGRVRQGEIPFDTYQAYALLPGRSPWICARLTQELRDRGIGEGDSVDRQDTLASVVQAAFPLRENFVSYARRWGVLQGAHVIDVLRNRRHGGPTID
jgi:CRISPR-associated endonuclease/helicase Cas3